MKILKFEQINNFGVFQTFNWDSSLSFENPKGEKCIYDFNTINILYGRNYSGKTSLSKIIRSFQTKQLPSNYEHCDFKITIEDNGTRSLSHYQLTEFKRSILVYNTDFVKEHLGFIVDDSKHIEAFTVTLGDENLDVLEKIQKLNEELGSDTLGFETGLFRQKVDVEKAVRAEKASFLKKNEDLQRQLSEKAAAIKRNTRDFNVVNYNKIYLERDIEEIMQQANYVSLTSDESSQYRETIMSESMNTPPTISSLYAILCKLPSSQMAA